MVASWRERPVVVGWIMSNGEDDKYRSRKWILATRTFWVATIQHIAIQGLILGAMVFGKLDAESWAKAAASFGSIWVWAIAAVLGLYGLANVTAIKFSEGRGVG